MAKCYRYYVSNPEKVLYPGLTELPFFRIQHLYLPDRVALPDNVIGQSHT